MSTAESQPVSEPARLLVVMGVAGCGKTTIGSELAAAIGGSFLDGDTFHPASNIEKMSRGEPLTDDDRWPWLERFASEIAAQDGLVVGGCSSLKRLYRDCIRKTAGEPVLFVYLDGSRELIASRMSLRTGHFMPTSLLDSQFEALEVPGQDENAIAVDISGTTDEVVRLIRSQLKGKLDE